MNYTIQYRSTNDSGSVSTWTSFASSSSLDDETSKLAEEYAALYKDDPNFQIVNIYKDAESELIDRMRACREIVELGHRVRADGKLRNRQPLKTAYIIFANQGVHNYMVYADNKNDEYMGILSDELNVDNVVFLQDTSQFTDVNLKPNFRVLGKRGHGKQAQALKPELAKLTAAQKQTLHTKLTNKEPVSMCGIDLTIQDLEVELTPKPGFASASSKAGVVVLDTSLTPELLERGWIADFKSILQNMRKDIGLELTDRVFIEVWSENKQYINLIDTHKHKLCKELLANDIALFRCDFLLENKGIRQIVINGVECRIDICKE